METPSTSHRLLESFLRASIGFAASIVPAVTTGNLPVGLGIMGAAGILSDIYLPQLLSKIPGSVLKNLLAAFIGVALLAGIGYNWYMHHDFYAYRPNQKLTVTSPDPKQPISLRRSWQTSPAVRSLLPGEQVVYTGEKSPRKVVRIPDRPDGIHFLVYFYRKVKTSDGTPGWVYGAYLK